MQKKQQQNKLKGIGGWLFLVIVLLLYGLTALINGDLVVKSITTFTHMLDKVLPVLLIVFALIFSVNLFIAPERVKKYLGKQSGVRGWVTAIVGGVLATGPVYAWYALLKELREKGMKTSLAAVFLCSRTVKLPLLPILIHYFGLTYTLVLTAYLIVFAVVTGLAMGKVENIYHHTE